MILFTSVFWFNLIFLTLLRKCIVWAHWKLKISIMYVGNVCARKDWGGETIDCTDNQVLLASFWGQCMGWEGLGSPWQPVAILLVKHCVPCACLEGHVPEAVNIPCSCEVQGNLYMLVISVREVLDVSGKILFPHILERHWAMLKTTGGGYQRATFSPSHLLLQWEMARLSYKSDGANKVTFLDTLIQMLRLSRTETLNLTLYYLKTREEGMARPAWATEVFWAAAMSPTPQWLCVQLGQQKGEKHRSLWDSTTSRHW